MLAEQTTPHVRDRGSSAPLGLQELVAGLAAAAAILAAAVALSSVSLELRVIAGSLLLGLLITALTARRMRERAEIEGDLSESQDRVRSLIDDSDDFVFSCDLAGVITAVNEAGARLTGFASGDLMGMDIDRLFSTDARAPQARRRTDIASSLVELEPGLHELELMAANGHRLSAEVRTRIIKRGRHPVAIQGVVRDMQERRRFDRQLLHLASHDPLTELFNRGRFEQELHLQLIRAKRHNTTGAVVFLDLDHFKDVNDTLGHAAGDQLLVAVSGRVRSGLRSVDMVARLGGDEFTAILPDADRDGARLTASRLLDGIRQESFAVAGQEFSITASAGVAMILPENADSAAEILSHADLAMYQAKEKGRNTVCVYEDGVGDDAVNSNFGWRRRIWDAMEQERFTLFAQPILDLRTNIVPKYELLLRLRESDGSVIDAGSFVDKAERFGLMPAIDRWVLHRAVELLSQHNTAKFAINFSSRALSDPELLPLIREELDAASIDPGRLIIEVTESAAMENVHAAQQFVAELKTLGCRFALDDFGAGFSSFYHLKMLDIDYLKIDGSLVRDLPRDPVDQHLVKAIVEVARALGKEVIAEFVTDAETLDIIRDLGVDFAQGYHVGRPTAVADAIAVNQRAA
jgi:diguanylate cyclase (GGDEF)-like protein/PAS domain S-box-containing protein